MPLGGIALATDFAIVVVTATLLSYIARRTGQPTIVAYILTGIVLGPVLFGIVTEEQLISVMAELGLGFLLFLLGIEMRFDRIKDILRPIVNISIGQTILQTALAFAIAYLLGFRSMDVVVIALATVFGATPVIVKLLDEKDELKTLPGRIDVGVLIVASNPREAWTQRLLELDVLADKILRAPDTERGAELLEEDVLYVTVPDVLAADQLRDHVEVLLAGERSVEELREEGRERLEAAVEFDSSDVGRIR